MLKRALKASYNQFLVSAIKNDNMESITSWVEKNLVNKNSDITDDQKFAFYEAEKSLITGYIMTNNFQELNYLINAIDHEKFNNNQKLKINECKVLANAIIEAQEYRCVREDGNTMHSSLDQLLRTKYHELIDETYKSDISGIVEQALSIVHHEPSKAVTTMGDDGASGGTTDI